MGWQSAVIFVCYVNIQNITVGRPCNKICSDENNCPLITLDTIWNLTSIIWIRIGMMTSLVFYKKTCMFLQADKGCVHRKSKPWDQVRSKWHVLNTRNVCASNVFDTANIFVPCYGGRAGTHSSEKVIMTVPHLISIFYTSVIIWLFVNIEDLGVWEKTAVFTVLSTQVKTFR